MSYIVIQLFCLPAFFIEKIHIKSIYFSLCILLVPIISILIFILLFPNQYVNNEQPIKVEILQLNNDIFDPIDKPQELSNKIINLISKSNANLLVFAENNYPIITDNNLDEIQDVLKNDQNVIIGLTRFDKNKFYNSLANINTKDIKFFDKKILVPFGEFLPFRKILNFFEPISGQYDYTSGKKNRLVEISNNLSYIPIICYEIIFYWKLLNENNYNSDFIINITNDIWFGKYIGPYQHLYLTKLRAAEFKKMIIRVSNNGISGIINEKGEMLVNTNLNEEKKINYPIKIINKKNYYLIHNFLNKYFLLILIILIFLNIFKTNAHRKTKI